jgi:hypothetical protein
MGTEKIKIEIEITKDEAQAIKEYCESREIMVACRIILPELKDEVLHRIDKIVKEKKFSKK